VYTALIYLWLFGLLEAVVLVAFRGLLRLSHAIAWLYVTTMALNALAALAGVLDWLRLKPAREAFGPSMHKWSRLTVLAFVIFVGFLGSYGVLVQIGAPGTNGGIFPEVMSLFTLRSFGAFYLSLTLGAIPLLVERNLATALNHAFASYGLIVAITVAAFIYLRAFDFAGRPGGLLYFGAYLGVGIPLLLVFRRLGTGASNRS
jgi:hypothetical protein